MMRVLLFPLLVQGPLIVGEHGIDLPISVLHDTAACGGLRVAVTGRVVAGTIQSDVAVDEDHLELEYLILG